MRELVKMILKRRLFTSLNSMPVIMQSDDAFLMSDDSRRRDNALRNADFHEQYVFVNELNTFNIARKRNYAWHAIRVWIDGQVEIVANGGLLIDFSGPVFNPADPFIWL